MNKNYFEIIRAGINSTFQDLGRNNLYHIGIPFSGAMDNRNYLLANKLTGNNHNDPVIEFAYQGPHLKYHGDKINIAITGDVSFKIKKGDTIMIVEAMKTMNHVPSTADGVVKEVCVEDGQPVEFGQTIIILE